MSRIFGYDLISVWGPYYSKFTKLKDFLDEYVYQCNYKLKHLTFKVELPCQYNDIIGY